MFIVFVSLHCSKPSIYAVLPETRCLEFTNPKLKNMCGQVELRFSAKFSNVLIVHVVCDPALQPEVVLKIFTIHTVYVCM